MTGDLFDRCCTRFASSMRLGALDAATVRALRHAVRVYEADARHAAALVGEAFDLAAVARNRSEDARSVMRAARALLATNAAMVGDEWRDLRRATEDYDALYPPAPTQTTMEET